MDPRTSTLPDNRGHRSTGVPNLCPYGCSGSALTEHGYCKHLVGFTIDSRKMELNEKFGPILHDKDGDELPPTGNFMRTGSKVADIEPSDLVVEVYNGRKVPTPTKRVYRPGPGDRRIERSATETTADVNALLEIQAQQQREIEELKRLVAQKVA